MSALFEQFTEVRNELAEVKRKNGCVAFFRQNHNKIDFKEDFDVFLELFQTDLVPFDKKDQFLIKDHNNFVEELYVDVQDAIDMKEINKLLNDKEKRLKDEEYRLHDKEMRLKELEKALIEEKPSMNQKEKALIEKETRAREYASSSSKTDNKELMKGILLNCLITVFV